MSLYNIEYLPYPMFPTTEDQKLMLKALLPKLEVKESYFLCVLLEKCFSEYRYRPLKNKIQKSLGDCFSLWGYFDYVHHLDPVVEISSFELRIVWINKLLEYTGE